jgi:hypothetical protein
MRVGRTASDREQVDGGHLGFLGPDCWRPLGERLGRRAPQCRGPERGDGCKVQIIVRHALGREMSFGVSACGTAIEPTHLMHDRRERPQGEHGSSTRP